MKQIKVLPDGWKCLIEECPPGFFYYKGQLCFKSEYGKNDGSIEVFCSSGEYFMPRKIKVQPVMMEESEEEL